MQKGEWEKITLEALAYQSGFNNRNSFTLSFKKFTGQTPSEYIRQLK
jgi:AraC-like DNA-binding protein